MSNKTNLGDSENFLPSWISNHLGEKSYMTDEVNILPSSPRKDFSSSEGNPLGIHLPSLDLEENIMPLDDLDRLRESCFIPSNVQIRLLRRVKLFVLLAPVMWPYEAAFHASLCLPIHPIIQMILQFDNIFLAQLVPNTWRSVVYAMVLQ